MNTDDYPTLPRRTVVRVDFGIGSGTRHPAISYTASAEVIARFAAALRQWNPDYRIHVEDVDPATVELPPELPTWRLFAWEEPGGRS
ncbi:hypothetical protein [Nocardia sp. NPDC048505]|uniref:hypothetical protein n=1 Tax=unclassified Nocardia TaxID=2637762 RepID=UPI0033F01FFB